MSDIIAIKNLSVVFGDIPALWDISVSFPKGKTVAIVGPNGAGKSTLMKAMLNLIDIETGEIMIDGQDYRKIRDKHKKIAYVAQRDTIDWLFPTTVLDVIMMGRYAHLGWFRRPGTKEKQLARDALAKFDMEPYADRQINQLSGGQKQRVLLARAYVQEADIYFLDEPFGGIDVKTERATLDLLQELKQEGKSIFVVTHDLQSLKDYFDYVLLLKTLKIACGSPEEVISEKYLVEAYGGHVHMIYDKQEVK